MNPLRRPFVSCAPTRERAATAFCGDCQDDPNRLREFYESLSLALKEYSGISEESLNAAKLDVAALTLRAPAFEQLVLEFLPEAREVVLAALKKLGKSNRATALAARFADFGHFFDALMRTKREAKIHNAATALRLMADLAIERLDQIERHGERQPDDNRDAA